MDFSWIPKHLLNRLLFVSFHLGLGITIWILLIVPVFNLFSEQSDRFQETHQTLVRYQHIASQERIIKDRLENLKTNASTSIFLKGSNSGAITADLVARLKSTIQSQGAHVDSVRSLEPITIGKILYYGAHADMRGHNNQIAQAINALESGKPLLFVKSASLRTTNGAWSHLTQEPELDVHIDVYGPVDNHAIAP